LRDFTAGIGMMAAVFYLDVLQGLRKQAFGHRQDLPSNSPATGDVNSRLPGPGKAYLQRKPRLGVRGFLSLSVKRRVGDPRRFVNRSSTSRIGSKENPTCRAATTD
jgi:hypothetical protein